MLGGRKDLQDISHQSTSQLSIVFGESFHIFGCYNGSDLLLHQNEVSIEIHIPGMCDECVVADQNMFLGLTIHLLRLEYHFPSHHSY